MTKTKKIQTTVDRMQQSMWKIAGSQKGKSKSELTNTKYLTSSPIKANIPKKTLKNKVCNYHHGLKYLTPSHCKCSGKQNNMITYKGNNSNTVFYLQKGQVHIF